MHATAPPLVPVTWQVASGFCSTHLSHYQQHHHNQTIIIFTKTYLTDSDSQIQSLSLFNQKIKQRLLLPFASRTKTDITSAKVKYTHTHSPPPQQQTRHSSGLLSAVTLLPLSSLFINSKAKDLSTRSSQAEVKTQKYKGHRFRNHENVFMAVVVVIWWQG